MRPVVQFDVDGVLADFMLGFTRLARDKGILRDDQITGTADQRVFAKYGMIEDPKVVDALWTDVKASRDFWARMPPLVDCSTFRRIDRLQDRADVYFATARVGKSAKDQTTGWLAARGICSPTVVITPRKGATAVALGATHAIDDKAGNAIFTAYVSKKTKSYVIDRAYNRFDHDVVGGGVIRVKTVDEFLDDAEAAAA